MADPKDALKKKIEGLKAQLAKEKAAGKTSNKDLNVRKLHKDLRRAQRKLALLSPLSYEQKVARVAKLTDMITKRMGELTQGAKKVQANPYVHSLRKKTKALTKRKKKLDRIAKKMAAAAKPAAAPAAPAPAAAPPAAESEKK
jgi:hypothetical protein